MDNNKKNNKGKNLILITTCIALVLITIFAYFMIVNKNKQEEQQLAYTELIKDLNAGKIEKIEMTTGSQSIKVKYTNKDEEKKVLVPSVQAFIELVQEKVDSGAINNINLEQKPATFLVKLSKNVVSLLPTILMVVLLVMIYKMQGLGEKGKVYDGAENDTKVKFDDVAGLEEEKHELIEVVNFLKEPKKFEEMGAKIPRGILLCGKPGTGKTLIAKAIAGEAGVPFIPMSGSEFIEMFAGLGASRVRKLFEKAKKIAPCIIFIDEIDAIGSRRTSNSGAESENNQH